MIPEEFAQADQNAKNRVKSAVIIQIKDGRQVDEATVNP